MTETEAADTVPPPAPNPLQHTHACPRCYAAIATCEEFCSTEFDEAGKLYGAAVDCAACANPPSEAADIFTGRVKIGDHLRSDEDGIVYEVDDIDDDVAFLTSVVGYPLCGERMRLAKDGSPARYTTVTGERRREPMWFRVTK